MCQQTNSCKLVNLEGNGDQDNMGFFPELLTCIVISKWSDIRDHILHREANLAFCMSLSIILFRYRKDILKIVL